MPEEGGGRLASEEWQCSLKHKTLVPEKGTGFFPPEMKEAPEIPPGASTD